LTVALNVLCFQSIGNYPATKSYIDIPTGFAKESQHTWFFCDFIYDFNPEMDLDKFDIIVFMHNFWPPALSPERKAAIKQARGRKIVFLQDEYQHLHDIAVALGEMGTNVIFSCLNPSNFETVYPKSLIPDLAFTEPTYTGFVPAGWAETPMCDTFSTRPIDVGYRSRVSPYYLGKLGDQKREIAEVVQTELSQRGFKCDISVAENRRYFGAEWTAFLENCKFQLGTPSGASIGDFRGEVIDAELAYRLAHPHSSFQTVWEKVLAPYEGNLVTDTISPRVFEYAAAGCVMVMTEGHYGGVLEPGTHYIELKSDFSNIANVAEQMRNIDGCERMRRRAYQDLIKSGAYEFSGLVARLDKIISLLAANNKTQATSAPDKQAFLEDMVTRHRQARHYDRTGLTYLAGEAGETMQRSQKQEQFARSLPFIGTRLRLAGGSTTAKLKKARCALELAYQSKAFRDILLWSIWKTGTGQAKFQLEDILKEILILGLLSHAHDGDWHYGKRWKNVVTTKDDGNTIIIKGEVHDDRKPVDLSGIEKAVATSKTILVDLTEVFPLRKFGNCLIWQFKSGDFDGDLRSAVDEYFHLSALDQVALERADLVAYALKSTLEVARV